MSVRCSACGREYDVTLFQFGHSVACDCGAQVSLRARSVPALRFIAEAVLVGDSQKYVRSPENASEAAECLGITAPRLKSLGLVDKVVNEPLGGAHRDPAEAAKSLKKAIADHLRQLQDLPMNQLLERRQERLVNYGKFKELAE